MMPKAIAQTKSRWLAIRPMSRDAHVPCERRIPRASHRPKKIRISVTAPVAKMKLSGQRTAFFTSAPTLASSAEVSLRSAKEVGHIAPLSSFASSLNPNVAYLDLNF